MCRACSETPDGLGRRCPAREEGFTPTESSQRNRIRSLKNARDKVAAGDPQGAADALVYAQAAQRDLDGGHPIADGSPADGVDPHRDFIVSPSSLDKAMGQIDVINGRRQADGLPRLNAAVSRETRPLKEDPLMAWEQVTVRVSGGTPEELQDLNLGRGIEHSEEQVVDTKAVLEASCAAVRLNDGLYVSRAEGGASSTPARVEAYLNDRPGGPMRGAMAPTKEDKSTAVKVRMWVRTQQPTSDYARAVRHAVGEHHMPMRDVGTASSAIAGYMRHEEEVAKARAEGTPLPGDNARGNAPAAQVTRTPGVSQWLGNKGDNIVMPARVEAVHEVFYENRPSSHPHMLYIFRTPDGHMVRWMASRTQGLRANDQVTLAGSVKAHSTFLGEKQTELNYCRVNIHDNA